MPGLLAALAGLGDNPLARREWRGLLHQSRDWRLWLGLRLPRDARGWGVPALAWCCTLPYALWGVVRVAWPHAAALGVTSPTETLDAMALSVFLAGVYVVIIAVALMAPAIARERQQETWASLRTTAASPHEIVVGLLAGRLGPVLLAYALGGVFWVAARPHYAPLLQPYCPVRLSGAQLALLVIQVLLFSLAAGLAAVAASARSRTAAQAVLVSTALAGGMAVVLGLGLWLLPQAPPWLVTAGISLGAGTAGYLLAVRWVRLR